MAVVLLNTVAVVMVGQSPAGSTAEWVWSSIDYACVLYFIVEAILKIRDGGWRHYWASGWNRFDFVVVAASLPCLLGPLTGTRAFSAILLLRLGRVFRLMRLLRFVPNGAHLAAGIGRSLRASLGVFLALAIAHLVLSVAAMFIFGERAPQFFGDPLRAAYSMLRVFTIEGWYEIPDAIAANASPVWAISARLFFSFAVFACGVLGLSLANAVFVDQMTMDNTDPLEARIDELTKELRALRSELKAKERPVEVPVAARAESAPSITETS